LSTYRNTTFVFEVCLASARPIPDQVDACEVTGIDCGKSKDMKLDFAD
jgi:hypothetical protein